MTAAATTRQGGSALVVGGLIGTVGAVVVGTVDPTVPNTQLSWPFSPTTFRLTETLWTISHALVLMGILALVRSLPRTAAPRPAVALCVFGFAAMIPAEFAFVFFANATVDSTAGTVLGTVMGLTSLLAAVGLIWIGVRVVRQRCWTDWHRYMPLAAGLFVPLVLLPVFGAVGWTPWPIAGWHALLTLLGVALYRQASDAARGYEPALQG